jgi:hypothetical protein
MRSNFAALAILALAAAQANPGADVLVVPPDRRPPPQPPPLPRADPDEVDRLATEGTEGEIMACLHTRRVSRTQHTDLLRRLHELDMQRTEARREETARREAAAKAQRQEVREAARAAAWSANPLSVRCPRCHAGKGKRCRGANAAMSAPHRERLRAWDRRS